MTKKMLTIGLCFLLVLVPLSGWNSKADSKNYEQAIATARTEIWNALSAGASSSATVAIMDNGKVVYAEGFGMRDREKNLPVVSSTQFNIGSVSKIFTTAAILQLCDAKKLELDKPVIDFMPEFTMLDSRYKDITVRMLLNHSSAFPGTYAYNGFASEVDSTYIENFMKYLAKGNLKGNPGKVSVYCNDGFTLAEALIQKVSGLSYSDYLDKNIFTKADMGNTSCYFKKGSSNVAKKYNNEDGKAYPLEFVNIMGSGGISSTAMDLCKFSQALLTNKVMSKESFAEYTSPQYGSETVPSGTPITSYGLGWDMVSVADFESQGIKVLSKNGGTIEFASQLYVLPKENLSVALSIAGSADTAKIATKITQALLEEKGIVKKSDEALKLPPKNATIPHEILGFVGFYGSSSKIVKVEFNQGNNALIYKMFNNGEFVTTGTYPYKEDGFFYMPPGIRIALKEAFGKKLIVYYLPKTDTCIVDGESLEALNNTVDASKFIEKKWIVNNLSFFDFSTVTANSGVISELPGYIYIDLEGSYTIYKLKDENTAEMVLPYSRDLLEPKIIEKNGKNILTVSGFTLMDTADASVIQTGEKISINSDNQNECRRFENDGIFKVTLPKTGRMIILSAALSVQYDSLMNGDKEVSVSQGSYVIFIGKSGELFEFKYTY